ncbi:MAG: hypothetical protein ABSB23_13855 [Bryobacteraceae bacterium]|jgi:hypothetical protein
MVCELSDELGIQYLMALDLVRQAQDYLNRAVTVTNIECASTELRRVEGFRLDTFRRLVEHCESHGCATPELEDICRYPLGARTMAVAS